MNKAVKVAAAAILGAGGAYLGVGAAVCEAVLGRKRLNREPENPLEIPQLKMRYETNESVKKSDDLYMSLSPADTVISTPKGKLHGRIITAETQTHIWAITVHGYSSHPRFMAQQAMHYYEKGYNVILPCLRGHRQDKRRHSSFGYYERYDIIEWINYILTLDEKAEIILHGCSMGAATVMLTTGEKLPQNVKCAVADCGYTSAWEEFGEQITNVVKLPRFPFLYAANTANTLFFGWNFKDCSPRNAVAASKTPTLFIHGEADTFVPYKMMADLYAHCSAEKDRLTCPGSFHDTSCEDHPDLYWEKTDGFILKFIK